MSITHSLQCMVQNDCVPPDILVALVLRQFANVFVPCCIWGVRHNFLMTVDMLSRMCAR